MSNAAYIQSILENAPGFVTVNPELHGWMITEEGVTEYCCSRCAARVIARGCWVFNGRSKPVWADSTKPELPCIGCEFQLEYYEEGEDE